MNVVEMFKSIQGEGIYSGRPMLFIRLAGCNLNCPWCDTKYALEGEFIPMCSRDIVSQARHLAKPPIKTICFTGGEPMIYQPEMLRKVARLLKTLQYQLHMETNGTIPPGQSLLRDIDFWSVSPKLAEDFEQIYPPSKISYIESVRIICKEGKAVQLKFVIAKEEETPVIKRFVEELELTDEELERIPIIIQPERFTFEQSWREGCYTERDCYLEKIPELIMWCEKNLKNINYQILPQLHYLLWKGKRGV